MRRHRKVTLLPNKVPYSTMVEYCVAGTKTLLPGSICLMECLQIMRRAKSFINVYMTILQVLTRLVSNFSQLLWPFPNPFWSFSSACCVSNWLRCTRAAINFNRAQNPISGWKISVWRISIWWRIFGLSDIGLSRLLDD